MRKQKTPVLVTFLVAILAAFSSVALDGVRNERGVLIESDECGLFPTSKDGTVDYVPDMLIIALSAEAVDEAANDGVWHDLECIRSAAIRNIMLQNDAYAVRNIFYDVHQDNNDYRDTAPDLSVFYSVRFSRNVDVLDICTELRSIDEVLSVEPNAILHQESEEFTLYRGSDKTTFPDTTSDGDWMNQWNLFDTIRGIGCPTAWSFSAGDSTVRLAIVEDRVDSCHYDLTLAEGRRYYYSPDSTIVSGPLYGDARQHSTQTAGIMCATTNNDSGIAGVAGGRGSTAGCSLINAQMFGKWTTELIARTLVCTAKPNGLNADVLNLSWGYSCYSEIIRGAIAYRYSERCNVVASMGQSTWEASDDFNMPADLDYGWITAVGAYGTDGLYCNNTDSCGFYSFYGGGIDILGPGWDCPTTDTVSDTSFNDPLITGFLGTSCAAPHVAGALGLLRSFMGNQFRPEDYDGILKQSSRDVADVTWGSDGDSLTWNERYGYGCLEIGNALSAVSTDTLVLFSNIATSWQAFTGIEEYKFMSGPYQGTRNVIPYRATTRISFNSIFNSRPRVWGVLANPFPYTIGGLSGANPNYCMPFSGVFDSTLTASGVDAFTFVYKVLDDEGKFLAWYPISPDSVPIGCRALGSTGRREKSTTEDPGISVSPNPFNSVLEIVFANDRPSCVRVSIYDLLGRSVRCFRDAVYPAGISRVTWDGKSDGGTRVASGLYFIVVDKDDERNARKVVYVK